jgi:hypothetical protein
MKELYSHNIVMPLATISENRPNLRMVNTYFRDNSFFIATHGLYNKMKEIAENPHVALAHNMFVAHGIGENIGHPLDQKNKYLREELRKVFSAFYEGHVHEDDKDTCFLKIALTDAVVYANDYRYSINFESNWAEREGFVVFI